MAKLCMGCMNPLPEDNTVCSVCGFDLSKDQNPAHCLPVTASLQGHYIVGRLMGEYPDHLLYLAYDRQMKEPCFIQEFFPTNVGRRDSIGGVQPCEGCTKVFEEYADQFRGKMRVLARMRELPAVVPVYDIFEENGTVYAVSDYCQGMTLSKKIKLSGGRIPWTEARSIFMSLLSSLIQLADAGVRHLAICPDHILIGSDGKPRLRNFSIEAAHHVGTNLTADLKPCFAAPEQYYPDEEVGAPADVYGLAATIFYTVTGTMPPMGDKRAKNSDDLFMSAEVAEELGQAVCVTLFNALQVLPENRIGTMAELRDELSVNPQVSALKVEAQEDIDQAEEEAEDNDSAESSKKSLVTMLIISLALLVAAVIVIVLLLVGKISSGDGGDGNSTASTTTTTTTTTRPSGSGGEGVVDNVIGIDYYQNKDKTFNDMPLELIGFRYDEGYKEGAILFQYPAANETAPFNTPIQVVVNNSRAAASATIPDVKGWEKAQAQVLLEALGFKVSVRPAVNPTLDGGLVENTHPEPGLAREVGETVTLLVSEKEPVVFAKVMNVVGWTETYAVKALEQLGFTTSIVYNPESANAKGVVDAVANVGTEQPLGTEIVLTVSSKEEQQEDNGGGGISDWLGDLFS